MTNKPEAGRKPQAFRTLEKHLEAIKAKEVTRSNVIGLRKAINMAEKGSNGWSVPSYASPEWRERVWEVEEALGDYRPKVIGELHDTGLTLLRNPRYRKRWTHEQQEAIDNLDHFRLVRFERIGRRLEYAVPVYDVWARDERGFMGHTFTFWNIPWQSGGKGPEVL